VTSPAGDPPLLKVNVDHVATLREARRGTEPDPVLAARAAEDAGAAGITLHVRGDRRHVQEHDLARLRETVRTEINLEMAAVPEMRDLALRHRPEQVTLVPERREEVTTEGGLQVRGAAALPDFVASLRADGMVVSLFVDPDPHEIEASARAGADAVELHTGRYANAGGEDAARELERLRAGAELAGAAGLRVFAGHGLDLGNVGEVARIPPVEELNIGHAIVSRAVFVGFGAAVREMLERIGPRSR
jgi:pyridoxine 5-phosphate synthase